MVFLYPLCLKSGEKEDRQDRNDELLALKKIRNDFVAESIDFVNDVEFYEAQELTNNFQNKK